MSINKVESYEMLSANERKRWFDGNAARVFFAAPPPLTLRCAVFTSIHPPTPHDKACQSQNQNRVTTVY